MALRGAESWLGVVSHQVFAEKAADALVQGGQLRAIETGWIGQQAFDARWVVAGQGGQQRAVTSRWEACQHLEGTASRNHLSAVKFWGSMYLTNALASSPMRPDRPVMSSREPIYLAGFSRFFSFFCGFATCGFGGMVSMRRSNSFSLGIGVAGAALDMGRSYEC